MAKSSRRTRPFQTRHPAGPFGDSFSQNLSSKYAARRAENQERIEQVCTELSDLYDKVATKKLSKVILYGEEKRKIHGFVAVLRSRSRELYASAAPAL